MKKLFSILILLVVLAGVGYLMTREKDEGKVSGVKTETAQQIVAKYKKSGIILFYGKGCPHCEKVEQFLTDNKIDQKVKYQTKEVWYNKENNKQMSEVAKGCGISADQLGVPFMWTGTDCKIGEDEVLGFFKSQAGIK